jgi:hypothetical protein
LLLSGIWTVSLSLAAVSLATMLVLILTRAVGGRRARRKAEQREMLLLALLAWLEDGGTENGDTIRRSLARDGRLATGLLTEVFEIVRGDGQLRLAALAEEAGIGDWVRRALRKGPVRDRLDAAEALIWFPSPKTTEALRLAVSDVQDDVSFAAAATLAGFGSELTLDERLLERLGRFGSSRRIELVLNRFAAQRPDALVDVVRDEALSDRVRTAALDAVTQTGLPGTLELLLSLEASPSADLRVAVARNLGALGHPDGAPTIGRYLADERWEVRSKAAEAVGRLGAIELGPALCALLLDENWWVRHRAGEALAKLGDLGIAALSEMAAIAAQTTLGQTATHILAERNRSAT